MCEGSGREALWGYLHLDVLEKLGHCLKKLPNHFSHKSSERANELWAV